VKWFGTFQADSSPAFTSPDKIYRPPAVATAKPMVYSLPQSNGLGVWALTSNQCTSRIQTLAEAFAKRLKRLVPTSS
jgi:hypothetical protein